MFEFRFDKRELVGILLVSLALFLFFKYPVLKDKYTDYKIDKLVEKERYQEAYDLLKEMDYVRPPFVGGGVVIDGDNVRAKEFC